MPTKNTIKKYIENGYYHLYSRGVDKREIFMDEQDCIVFLYYLKIYLSSPDQLRKDPNFLTPKMLYKIYNLNLHEEVDLLSFALMPNHFHLQIKQKSSNGIESLTRRMLTGYVKYFNRRHSRVGALFESAYKAVNVTTDEQNLYLSAYIHKNPMKLVNPKFNFTQFSSYPYYLKQKNADWVKTDEIATHFNSNNKNLSYQEFVEGNLSNGLNIDEIVIEEEDC